MFGNLMNDILILKMQEQHKVIRPFDPSRLQFAQYKLSAAEILYEKDGLRGTFSHKFSNEDEPFMFEPLQYALAVVRETVVLPDGIVGRFIPESKLIEQGLGIVAGKLDSHYGEKGEQIRFGIHNLRRRHTDYSAESPLGYIEFFDLRGLPVTTDKRFDFDEQITRLRTQAASLEAFRDAQTRAKDA